MGGAWKRAVRRAASVPKEAVMTGNVPTPSPETPTPPAASRHSLMSLREEVDRLFENFFTGAFGRRGLFELDPFRRLGAAFGGSGELSPEVDVKETPTRFEIAVELPGIDDKDVDVTLRDGVLSIAGEKRAESHAEKADVHLSERSYGRFVRSFRLPETVDEEQVTAAFDKGVLVVTVPKRAEAHRQEKKIEVTIRQP
jgi:HSP20 family protein